MSFTHIILFLFFCSNDVIKFVLNADGEWVPTLAVQVPNQTIKQGERVPNQPKGNQGAQVRPTQTRGQSVQVPNQTTVRSGTKPNNS